MNKNWSDIAWADYLSLQSDKKLLKKVNELLKDIDIKLKMMSFLLHTVEHIITNNKFQKQPF